MAKIIFLCALFSVCFSRQILFEFTFNRVAVFDHFWTICPEFLGNTTYFVRNMNVYSAKSTMMFDFEVVLKVDLPVKTLFVLDILKCASKESPDTCQKVTSLRTNNYCGLLGSKTDFWTPMMECFDPPHYCPLKKGVYKGTNCTFDMKQFRLMPVDTSYYWKTRALWHNRKNTIHYGCAMFDVHVTYRRNN